MIFNIAYILLALGFVFALYRLILGPSVFDRIVSLDLVSALLMCGLGIYSVETKQFVFLDVILAIALIAFLGTVAFASYLDREMIDAPSKSADTDLKEADGPKQKPEPANKTTSRP